MDKSSAGISGHYARSGNSRNQQDDRAASSRRGRYRHATVRQWDNTQRTTPGCNQFYRSTAVCLSQHLQCRSVNLAQGFYALINQEIIDNLVRQSERFGHRYDGRCHGQYASSIKKYTLTAKRPLNRAEQSQLIRFLQNFTVKRSWNWRSLTTTFHSLTSAGIFTPHNPMNECVKRTQTALLSTLLDVLIFKCHQKPQARDIDAIGITNLLWAIAKLVDSGQKQTPELKQAVAALMPHLSVQKDRFIPQHLANLLWAMAKLVDNGQEQTAEIKKAVAALLPHVNAQKDQLSPQNIANLLWAVAKLVDNGQEQRQALKETVAMLLPQVNAKKSQFNAQGIANLLWVVAKLVDNGQEWTPGLNAVVNALLPHVNVQKDQFNAQHIANLLWAMAKLVGNGQIMTPEFKEAMAVLLPLVNVQKANFKLQGITNLLWAMAKLTGNGQERTPELNEAMAALLPHVIARKADFLPQEIANLLWAMAKVVNGPGQIPMLNKAVAALLPYVKTQKDQPIPQQIANLLWALAKLVDSGQEQTPEFKEAVAALLPHVITQKAGFKPQEIANLLWAMAKLVDNGQECTPEFYEAVAALLPHVITRKADFIPQEIANQLWAMAKLVDNSQEQTAELNEAVAALLPYVNAQKTNFKPQEIANLLWATAKLGELVELPLLTSTCKSLVYRISDNPRLSQQDIFMSLWGVMVCCARLSLASNNENNGLEKHMDNLFTRLKNTSTDNEEDQSIIAMAASWLGRPCPFVPHYQTIRSRPQTDFRNQLQSCIPSLKIEEEKSLNSLPPVDLLLPDHNIVIEVQGLSHYVRGDLKTRKGSTLLKIALLQKAGFEVVEIPANTLCNRYLMQLCIDKIKTRVDHFRKMNFCTE
ncbi:RAP domain-containing protein [Salinisphaera sp. G21_0]|uniref:RAP domain-containing protein n=1 Tax=Salinisphaera sp. G21_0 TaxID=2821094 RepID=UPI001ADA49B1|nr:RAP domain-containing protein [Salinisphaera sp. G21_0]MBO9484498.1 DUF1601 domain-containing protein [Salinisphaera sp. G21_0]